MNNIPRLLARGKYTINAPFDIGDGVFTCHAVRTYDDCYRDEFDVFVEVYAPKALNKSVFESDVANHAVLVTLLDDVGTLHYVPSTYIAGMPSGETVAYRNHLLSIDLGSLPDTLNLDEFKASIVAEATDVLGVTTAVVVDHILPIDGYVTVEDHASYEVARKNNITRSETLKTRNSKLTDQVNGLAESNRIMEDYLIDNGHI